MASCPACDTEIDVDEFDVDRGDELSCPECGSNLKVAAVSPVALQAFSEGDEDDSVEENQGMAPEVGE